MRRLSQVFDFGQVAGKGTTLGQTGQREVGGLPAVRAPLSAAPLKPACPAPDPQITLRTCWITGGDAVRTSQQD